MSAYVLEPQPERRLHRPHLIGRSRQPELGACNRGIPTLKGDVIQNVRSIDPQVGIAVDVTHATDCPTIDKRQQGEIGLGKGPVIFRGPNMNPVVTERLLETSKVAAIPHQLSAIARATPNDANVLEKINGGGNGMPSYKDVLSDAERTDLIAYLKTL